MRGSEPNLNMCASSARKVDKGTSIELKPGMVRFAIMRREEGWREAERAEGGMMTEHLLLPGIGEEQIFVDSSFMPPPTETERCIFSGECETK
jgi:hypothetical protein